ncbi:MAG: lipid A deacylase LpxR family protein [Pyrinomonadaceae bacterium]|nr:lipid A deacylase LpxR family protein [Sphingobacteriaceae bacterium]
MRLKKILLIFLCFYPVVSYCQKIDNTTSYRDIGTDAYFRFTYDNDYFTATDYYFTQGYSFEFISPKLRKNPLTKLLVGLNDSTAKFGLSLEHVGFTPTSIRFDEVLQNDRPFASYIMLKSAKITTNTKKQERLSSILSTGVIGPAAFGGKMQTTIHRWIDGVEPHGWQNQIKNDVVLNYELNHEKLLFNSRYLSVNSNVNLRLGTLNTKAQTGATFVVGKYKSALNSSDIGGFQLYIYTQPLVNIVGYDATLQGGLFNRNSVCTLNPSDITRINLQNNFGAILKRRGFFLEYSQAVLGKEFKTGKQHRWGGIKIAFAI